MVTMDDKIEELLKGIPRVDIGFFPTPLQKLENMSEKYGLDFLIKRDDLSGPGFGGNKVRKLEFIIAEALERDCNYVVTYGGFQSNHCRQLTAACKKYGLEPILYLISEKEPEEYRANLHLDKIMDAEINFLGEELDDMENAMEKALEEGKKRVSELEENGFKCYDCPPGGFDRNGTLGFLRAFGELVEQLEEMEDKIDYIVHANGTGGTYTGLMMGKKIIESEVEIIPFSVSSPSPDFERKVSLMCEKVKEKLGDEVPTIEPEEMKVDTDHYGPGYDVPYDGSVEATKELARKEGIVLGPAYTAKAMAGLLDYIEKGKIEDDSSILFWHTGGTPTIFAEKEIVGNVYD